MNFNKTTLCLVALISVSSMFAGRKEIAQRDARLAAFDASVKRNQQSMHDAMQATRLASSQSNSAYQTGYEEILNGQRPASTSGTFQVYNPHAAENVIRGAHPVTAPVLSYTPNLEPQAKQPAQFARYKQPVTFTAQTPTTTEITSPMYTFVTKYIPVRLAQQVHPLVRKDGVVTPGALIINQPTTVLMPVVERKEVPAGHLYRQLSFLAPNNEQSESNPTPVTLRPVLSFLNQQPAALHPVLSFEITK